MFSAQSLFVLLLAMTLVSAAPERLQGRRATIPRVCHPNSFKVRKEWGDLTRQDRRTYIAAVRCLQQRPSQLDRALYNATSRYEDFVAVHINATRRVHNNGVFLSWHRGYISLFERSLAEECGYEGALPYWDWVKHAADLKASPLFDGSDASFSGDGLPIPDELKPPCIIGNITCPKGTGGGCVTSGPFEDYKIGYTAVDPTAITDPNPGLPAGAFAYDSGCFVRDLNQHIASAYQTAESLHRLVSAATIAEFQAVLDSSAGVLGLHLAGHALTGPRNGNVFSSPLEPTFFLHHAMLDRVWARWQEQDCEARVYGDNALFGTVTMRNIPPSANATFDTLLQWGSLGPARPILDVIALGRGDYCYTYE